MSTGMAVDLLSNASATGSAAQWPGGKGSFVLAGTVSGATITLQTLGPDGSTWLTVSSATTLTAVGHANFDLGPGQIRCLVASGTPSGLYAKAVRVPS